MPPEFGKRFTIDDNAPADFSDRPELSEELKAREKSYKRYSVDRAYRDTTYNPLEGQPKDLEAQIARGRRLRQNEYFQVLAKLIKADPILYNEYLSVAKRSKDFKTDTTLPRTTGDIYEGQGDFHRDYTAMFAALALSERGLKLLNLAIDRFTTEDSNDLKEQIKRGDNYNYELVVGAGQYGGIYNTERAMYYPQNPALTLEAAARIGGQFDLGGSGDFDSDQAFFC
jgi:hypothetical protein